jgi:hypothetical protein
MEYEQNNKLYPGPECPSQMLHIRDEPATDKIYKDKLYLKEDSNGRWYHEYRVMLKVEGGDNELLYTTQDERDCDLFIAQLKIYHASIPNF